MDKDKGPKLNDDECVSQMELKEMMRAMTEAFKKYQDSASTSYEQLDRRVAELVTCMDVLEARPPPPTPAPAHSPVDNDDDDDDVYAPLRQRLARNRQGMGGNGRRRRHNPEPDHDPFAKIKFPIPPFMGSYYAEAYLDWEMTVEQKFNSHLVPEQHRVRQATSEFRDFAIIWWNELINTRAAPQTWNALKEEMRARFVPPSYRRDLRKKLQRLDQGDMSVQEYYQELQKGMLRCGVVEDPEDQMVRFYGGLMREIQDIVDYKEYHSIQRLFHLSMLAEKRIAGSSTTEEQHFRSTPATGASQGVIIFGRTDVHIFHCTFGCCSKTCYDHLFHMPLLRHQVPPLPGTWSYSARLPQQMGIHCY